MDFYINKDTQLCMSLAARPGNFGTRFHNFLYRELGLNFIYKAFTTRDIGSAIGGVRATGNSRMRHFDAIQRSMY